jgi:hypothetical protein
MLEEVQKHRESHGKYQSMSSLFTEAVYGYYGPELKKIHKVRKLKSPPSLKPAHG